MQTKPHRRSADGGDKSQGSDARCKEARKPANGELGAVGERDEAHELVDDPERSLHRGPPGGGHVGLPVAGAPRSGPKPAVPGPPPSAATAGSPEAGASVVTGEVIATGVSGGLGAACAEAGARAAADCGGGRGGRRTASDGGGGGGGVRRG